MKRVIIITLLIILSTFTYAQYQTGTNQKGIDYYVNPIFAGNYPDPGLLLDGNDYYIVHSSFEYYSGLWIWHSRDLKLSHTGR